LETPPQPWGRHKPIRLRVRKLSNTHGCTWKAGIRDYLSAPSWKHPQWFEEDSLGGRTTENSPEAPPLTWGRHVRLYPGLRRTGNTPAGAGKTHACLWCPLRAEKHPDCRREYAGSNRICRLFPETPPLAWRRLRVSSTVAPDLRNTHRSGEEKNDDGLKREIEDTPLLKWGHSHSCGEDQPHAIAAGNALETTPLAWGRLFFLMHYSDIL